MNKYAPIILFVYRREEHARQVLDALANNTLAKKSDLFIFSDAAKNTKAAEDVMRTRKMIRDEMWKNYFRSVTIIERTENFGLARSIITGVTEIIRKYGRVIVIEDDSISRCDFLEFMNACLDYYRDDRKIWSIGGYSFLQKADFPADYSQDVYCVQRTCSYAWATWADRWEMVDWEVKNYRSFKNNWRSRKRFNQTGNNHSVMLDSQMNGRIDSWAIRFCFSMFEHDMVTVYPVQTRIRNIGEDGSGVHFNKVRTASASHNICFEEVGTFIPTNVTVHRDVEKAFAANPAVHLTPPRLLWKYLKNRI